MPRKVMDRLSLTNNTDQADVRCCEGFRTPAARDRCRTLWRPASESLHRRCRSKMSASVAIGGKPESICSF